MTNTTQDSFPPIIQPRNNKNQARLRLAWDNPDFADDPRKYAQSTSGRMDSTGTFPPLSRSSAMAVDSAIRSFVESAFRKYPADVPQRFAYRSCAATSRELRYVRSGGSVGSIEPTLPYSKVFAIPFVHSSTGVDSYDERMDKRATRRRRLALLVSEFRTQEALASAVGFEANYISQLLSGKKSFGEKTARKIEKGAKKPEEWLDEDVERPELLAVVWPFAFDRALWDRLPALRRHEMENTFLQLILGASVQEAATPLRKGRTG